MSYLISGVGGLLGSRLADYLIEGGEEVIGIDDLSGGYVENIHPDVKFYEFNLTDADSLRHVFEKHFPRYIFHFAAYAAEGLSPFIRTFNYTNNLICTANIVNCCINYDVQRLVFTSSMAVYGNNKTPFEESMPRKPIDPYGVAKAACEMDIEIAGDQHGLDWCILRPHNVYGQKQNIWDKYRNVLGIWMYQHLNGLPLTIFGDGKQQRAFSYIDDCLEPLRKSAVIKPASKEIINLGGIHENSILEAANILLDVIGDGKIEHLEPRHEVKNAWSTHQKSVDVLGYEHKTSLHDGLSEMWEWAKNQPNKLRSNMTYEITKGLYNVWK